MNIISHRGLWNFENEKNKEIAFVNSFNCNFGIETDLRDYKEKLKISHNIADEKSMEADELFKVYSKYNNKLTLALNIKSDGIQNLIRNFIDKYNISNYFLFDMSVPEQYVYIKEGFKVFTRQSDIEKLSVLYEKANGVWLDAFYEEWIDIDIIKYHLNNNKKVCIVSPELHGRQYIDRWKLYKKMLKELRSDDVMLCTDKPVEAREFFYE